MKKLMKNRRPLGYVATALGGMGAISAHAALPVEVTTALADATTDITTLGGAALLLAGAAFAIFALYRRTPRG